MLPLSQSSNWTHSHGSYIDPCRAHCSIACVRNSLENPVAHFPDCLKSLSQRTDALPSAGVSHHQRELLGEYKAVSSKGFKQFQLDLKPDESTRRKALCLW